MLGLQSGDDIQVEQLWSTENSWTANFLTPDSPDTAVSTASSAKTASRLNRFAIAPIEILKAQKYARSKNLDIVGIYHSHPDHPAIPSEHDLASAQPFFSYVIASLEERGMTTIKSYRLNEDAFKEEEFIIT